ncbi:MAG: hypothetical protein GX442_22665 [Candidatus Riflebacteria bacterium]|nr:hypothetical protein [Candidatus Riflebacteria bacterium]
MLVRGLLVVLILWPLGVWGAAPPEVAASDGTSLSLASSAVEVASGPGSALPASVPPSNLAERLDALAREGKGLLVVCASKEGAERGPGQIDVAVLVMNGRISQKIGVAALQEGPPTAGEVGAPGRACLEVPVATGPGVVTSRYYGEFPLPAGNQEIQVMGKFPVPGAAKKSIVTFRTQRFPRVEVQPGKAVLLEVFWQDDQKFGKTPGLSATHHQVVDAVAAAFGGRLSAVRQHDEP